MTTPPGGCKVRTRIGLFCYKKFRIRLTSLYVRRVQAATGINYPRRGSSISPTSNLLCPQVAFLMRISPHSDAPTAVVISLAVSLEEMPSRNLCLSRLLSIGSAGCCSSAPTCSSLLVRKPPPFTEYGDLCVSFLFPSGNLSPEDGPRTPFPSRCGTIHRKVKEGVT